MTNNMPLSLSDIQLERLLQAAELLPVHARDNFLRSIANRVADLPQIDTAAIETVIAVALSVLKALQDVVRSPVSSNLFTHTVKPRKPPT
jgi:hypothetical protein